MAETEWNTDLKIEALGKAQELIKVLRKVEDEEFERDVINAIRVFDSMHCLAMQVELKNGLKWVQPKLSVAVYQSEQEV